MINKNFKINVIKKASICRYFEEKAFENIKNKSIKLPVYLSAGQELIASTLSEIILNNLKIKPLIFAQHRSHSTYIAFGGNIKKLIYELLGSSDGCTYGMGGSASIHEPNINMFGHDGHMGTQVPIGVGACFVSKKPTIIFMGDASAEEDYVLGALGWAATKNLPILFIVEDNNFSILTEKKIRRNWHMHKVAKSFGMRAYNINDDPDQIVKLKNNFFTKTTLLNINTNRLFWHSGAGQDCKDTFDRYKTEVKKLGKYGKIIDLKSKSKIHRIWEKILEKQ